MALSPSRIILARVGPAVRSMSPMCPPMARTVLLMFCSVSFASAGLFHATEYDAAHVVLLEEEEDQQHRNGTDHDSRHDNGHRAVRVNEALQQLDAHREGHQVGVRRGH